MRGENNRGLSQDDIAAVFRAGELQRRAARMKIMQNHLALENEPLSEEERKMLSRPE